MNDDNPKLSAALEHMDDCGRLAMKAKGQLIEQSFRAAETAWHMVAMAIRKSLDTKKIDKAWQLANSSELRAIKCGLHMQNAREFSDTGDEGRMHQNILRAQDDAKVAQEMMLQVSQITRHPYASQYLAAYRRMPNGKDAKFPMIKYHAEGDDQNSGGVTSSNSEDLDEYNPRGDVPPRGSNN